MRPGFRDRFERRGDWLVPRDELEAAEAEVETWSAGRRARDRLSRAPIEPNREEWEENSRGFDYPGVDTPTDEPRESLLDAYWATRIGRRRTHDDARLSPEDPEPWMGSSLLGGLARDGGRLPDDTLGRVFDAFGP